MMKKARVQCSTVKNWLIHHANKVSRTLESERMRTPVSAEKL